MSTLSQFTGNAKPRQVTVYTSGSGTYTPSAPNAWCYVLLIGGGGSGGLGQGCYGTGYGYAGGAGLAVQVWTKVVSTASYAVGAAGYWTNSGYPYYNYSQVAAGATTFNGLTAAAGGTGATGYNNTTTVGASGLPSASVLARPTIQYVGNPGYGGGGGAAGNSNGCSYSYGGSGTAGVIVIQDFGP